MKATRKNAVPSTNDLLKVSTLGLKCLAFGEPGTLTIVQHANLPEKGVLLPL